MNIHLDRVRREGQCALVRRYGPQWAFLDRAMRFAAIASALQAGAPAQANEAMPIGDHHQLFFDDHIVESHINMVRRVQPVTKHPANPLITREYSWEGVGVTFPSVIYDEDEKIFKAWTDGLGVGVFYFTSQDGIHWERPMLRLFPEFDPAPTNRVVLSGFEFAIKDAPKNQLAYLRSRETGWTYFCNLGGVVKDRRDPDPQKRYKMSYLWIDRNYRRPGQIKPGKMTGLGVAFSPDGIHWTPVDRPVSEAIFDCPLHVTFDEALHRWILLGRVFGVTTPEKKAKFSGSENFKFNAGRAVVRLESEDFVNWSPARGELVMASDELDSEISEIYSLRTIPYEGIQIGLVHFFHNEPDDVRLYFQLAVSRDGKTWRRLSDRSAFIPLGGVGEWDRSTHMPPSSDPIIVGDEIRIYYSGRNIVHPTRWKVKDDLPALTSIPPFRGAIGLATLKRDRFVAMEASFQPGKLRTKPFTHNGKRLHVNAAVPFGILDIGLLGEGGRVMQKATIQGKDSVDIVVSELTSFSAVAGQPVQLEFSLSNGRLFSFWVN